MESVGGVFGKTAWHTHKRNQAQSIIMYNSPLVMASIWIETQRKIKTIRLIPVNPNEGETDRVSGYTKPGIQT